MPQAKKHTAEEIIPKFRTAELEIAKGRTAAEAAKKRWILAAVRFPNIVVGLIN